MKTIYRKLSCIALSTLLCAFLAIPANAQRNNNNGGGGGGGTRTTGGGGGGGGSSSGSSRPSGGGGGVSTSRPSGSGSVGVARSGGSNGYQRSGVAPQRSGQPQGYLNRGVAARGNYGYAPRQGVAARGTINYAPRLGVTPRNNTNYAPRLGVSPRGATGGYRTSPQIGYGRGGYWGTHGYNHYYHGYYNSYYLPRLGFSVGFLPYGYYPFYWGDYQYYYSDGLYYQFDNNQYTVVEPPIGAEITTLPDKAQSIVINGQQYYELNGVYYQPITKDDGTVVYEIVGKDGELNTNSTVQDTQVQGPQMGDIVTQLPPDCRRIKVNGEKLWVSPDGIYYQEQVDASGNKTYKIVGLPSDEPEQN